MRFINLYVQRTCIPNIAQHIMHAQKLLFLHTILLKFSYTNYHISIIIQAIAMKS